MALIWRKCMKINCYHHRQDRTWFNEDYDLNNPFLCECCDGNKICNEQQTTLDENNEDDFYIIYIYYPDHWCEKQLKELKNYSLECKHNK